MTLKNTKFLVAAAYMLVVAAGAVASGLTTGTGLVVFAALAVLPAGALLVLWHEPSQTMSETIQATRR